MKTGEFICLYETMIEDIEKDSKEQTKESEARRNIAVMHAAEALIDSMIRELPPDKMAEYTNEATDIMAQFIPIRTKFWEEMGWPVHEPKQINH